MENSKGLVRKSGHVKLMRDISKTVEKVAKGLCTTFNKIRYMSVNGRITHGMGMAMSLI